MEKNLTPEIMDAMEIWFWAENKKDRNYGYQKVYRYAKKLGVSTRDLEEWFWEEE